MRPRAFFDATVLFSATYSDIGASRELVRQAVRGSFQLVTSPYVLEEARRNIAESAPELLALHEAIVAGLSGYMQVGDDATAAQVKEIARFVVAKDAPVVAAALAARVGYLVTLDRKHLLQDSVRERSGLNILTPGDFLQALRGQEGT